MIIPIGIQGWFLFVSALPNQEIPLNETFHVECVSMSLRHKRLYMYVGVHVSELLLNKPSNLFTVHYVTLYHSHKKLSLPTSTATK